MTARESVASSALSAPTTPPAPTSFGRRSSVQWTRASSPQQRASLRCGVCGGTEIDRDEVLDRGVLRLATCTRCDHRWTQAGNVAVVAPRRETVAA